MALIQKAELKQRSKQAPNDFAIGKSKKAIGYEDANGAPGEIISDNEDYMSYKFIK